ncbi:ArgS-related anticodon-binding protein NrtL [Streptomyces sp. NPDC046909]|uniref:ArgS-related anticodon-binding protein NrtL n=1 Tax=Streptomyces sp. NPDC046909 TaxID=3155617 RepID=UPI0033C9D532
MTPVELSRTVLRAVRRAVDGGELSVAVPERAVVTRPGPGGSGDYATNVALQLARPAGRPSEQVAEILRPYLLDAPGVTDVTVTGPGFLNISLGDTASVALVEEILRRGKRYGHSRGPSPDFLRLACPEEVRAVVVMDAVARILRSQGAAVHTWCAAEPSAQWVDVLGVRVDGHPPKKPHAPQLHLPVRPVPAPVDPLPLGRDAARWALLYPAAHDRPRITDEHLVQRESNPLFRIRYTHARTRALSRNAADLGFEAVPGDVQLGEPHVGDAHPAEFHPAERHSGEPRTAEPHPGEPRDAHRTLGVLITTLADHPRVLAQAAAHRTPDRLARHLVTVADAALPFLPTVLPRGDEKPSAAHRARLALAEAVGAVLAGGLTLLGIDAPDHI